MGKFFTSLPLWVRLPFTVACFLVSAFNDKLPPDFHIVGLYAGLLLGCFSAVATAWHWYNGWRERNGKPRAKLQPIYFIGIGLFIAIVGLGWQIVSWPQIGTGTKISLETPDPSAPQAPLSIAEQNYRLELRKFIMTCLKDSSDGFLSTMGSINNAYSKKIGEEESRPLREIIAYALQSGVQGEYTTLYSMVNKPIESIDINAVENALVKYLLGYVYSQRTYFIKLKKFSGTEPLPETLKAWEQADQECARSYRDLRTSPVADKLRRDAVPEPFSAANRSE
jgi:hypothetical protein